MVCDLDVLDAALQRIDDTVRDKNLEIIRPPDAEAVTVEVFARWAHDTLADDLRSSGADMLTVRVLRVGGRLRWVQRPARLSDRSASTLVVTIITRGSPDQLSGGYLYHRRLAEAAPDHGAVVDFVSASPWTQPAPAGPRRRRRRQHHGVVGGTMGRPPSRPAGRHPPPAPRRRRARRDARPLATGPRPRSATAAASCSSPPAPHSPTPSTSSTSSTRHASWSIEPGCDLPPVVGPASDARRGRRVALLCVANWLPGKGILELLEAVSTMPADHATLHLAGRQDVDPGYGARVRARIAAPDLRDRVVAHGPLARRCGGAVRRQRTPSCYRATSRRTAPSTAKRSGRPPDRRLGGRQPAQPHHRRGRGLRDPDRRRRRARLGAAPTGRRRRLAGGARRRGSPARCALPTWADTAATFFDALRALPTGPG